MNITIDKCTNLNTCTLRVYGVIIPVEPASHTTGVLSPQLKISSQIIMQLTENQFNSPLWITNFEIVYNSGVALCASSFQPISECDLDVTFPLDWFNTTIEPIISPTN